MAFAQMEDDMNIISSLGDEPNEDNGLSAFELKAKFDTAGRLAKEAINKLIAALGASTAAKNIGFARSTQVPAGNVQDAIDNVQGQLAGVSQGAVANGSITSEKLADGAVTAEKVTPGALATDVSSQVTLDRPQLNGEYIGDHNANYYFQYVPSLGIVFFSVEVDITRPVAAGERICVVQTGLPLSSRGSGYHAAYCAGTCGEHASAYIMQLAGGVMYAIYPSEDIQNYTATTYFQLSGWYFTDEAEVT